jgi:hypothetical protein
MLRSLRSFRPRHQWRFLTGRPFHSRNRVVQAKEGREHRQGVRVEDVTMPGNNGFWNPDDPIWSGRSTLARPDFPNIPFSCLTVGQEREPLAGR